MLLLYHPELWQFILFLEIFIRIPICIVLVNIKNIYIKYSHYVHISTSVFFLFSKLYLGFQLVKYAMFYWISQSTAKYSHIGLFLPFRVSVPKNRRQRRRRHDDTIKCSIIVSSPSTFRGGHTKIRNGKFQPPYIFLTQHLQHQRQ